MTAIAITGEVGSPGSDVAAGGARELNLKIVYSEIVANQIAERMGVEDSAVQRYVDGSASLLERWLIDRRKLSRYTSEKILRFAQEGNVLIRGWGADTLLRGLPQVISVRVCVPMEFRVRTMMQKMGIRDADAVRKEIERFDAAHIRVMRSSFNVEREDALLYHLVLNPSGCQSMRASRQSATWRGIRDSRITRRRSRRSPTSFWRQKSAKRLATRSA
jgi:cytidylate kinase